MIFTTAGLQVCHRCGSAVSMGSCTSAFASGVVELTRKGIVELREGDAHSNRSSKRRERSERSEAASGVRQRHGVLIRRGSPSACVERRVGKTPLDKKASHNYFKDGTFSSTELAIIEG